MRSLVLGVDVGTRSARAGVFSADGKVLASASNPYEVLIPQPGWAEQDPLAVWEAMVTAVRQALTELASNTTKTTATPNDIAAICLTGTAVTLLACDQNNVPLQPAILWMDTRSTAEASEISATNSEWLRYSGGQVSPEWGLPKALWLKRQRPELYARTWRVVELIDWLGYQLCGQWTTSLNTVSAQWSFVSHLGGWPQALLASCGAADLLPRLPTQILPPGSVIGELTQEAADLLGLLPGTPVAQGLMDSYAAALGLNVFAPGRLVLSLGTSSAYLTILDTPRFHPGLFGPVPDALEPGTWVLQGGQTSAGSLVQWFLAQLGAGLDIAQLDARASAIPPGAEGLLALDCWQGNRTPHRDPLARGAFWGLHLGHSTAHLYRAILESVAFGGRQILATMSEVGIGANELWVCGGGSRSRFWMQIHADVLGLPLVLAADPEMALAGAAVCAAVAAGFYSDLRSAAATMETSGTHIEPNEQAHTQYAPFYAEYQAGYAALQASMHRLDRLRMHQPDQ